MGLRWRSWAAATAVLAGLATALGGLPIATSTLPFLPHPPIAIRGDDAFSDPLSGVVNPHAAGTAEDPYVIEGWDLTPLRVQLWDLGASPAGYECASTANPSFLGFDMEGQREFFHGIEIKDTTKHVTIRGNWIHARAPEQVVYPGGPVLVRVDSEGLSGILVENASNVRLEGNTIGDADAAAPRLQRGVCARDATNLAIAGNTALNTIHNMVETIRGDGVAITGNVFAGSRGFGPSLQAAGVRTFGTTNVLLENNRVSGHAGPGLHVGISEGARILGNTVEGNGLATTEVRAGIRVGVAHNAVVRDNLVRDNHGYGVYVSNAQGVQVHDNNLVGNCPTTPNAPACGQLGFVGLKNNCDTCPVDATLDWWGCTGGPGAAGCDRAEGQVTVVPSRSAPVAGAGAEV